MSGEPWMLYGANGYTGAVIAAEAVRQGHSPILAGRSEAVRTLAEGLRLPWRMFDLADAKAAHDALRDVPLVLNAAGPFTRTAVPLARIAIASGVHYADVSAELSVTTALRALDEDARRAGVAVVPTLAFSTVATDSVAAVVAARLPDATTLEIATVLPDSGGGPGQAATLRAIILMGGQVRRGGRIVRQRFGRGGRRVAFPGGSRPVIPVALPNIETAYWVTDIPDITVSLAMTPVTATVLRVAGPLVQWLTERRPVSGAAKKGVMVPEQPLPCYVWACATNDRGGTAEAWLQVGDGYRFTAEAAVGGITRILAAHPVGVCAPMQVLGPDFVAGITGVRRFDAVPA